MVILAWWVALAGVTLASTASASRPAPPAQLTASGPPAASYWFASATGAVYPDAAGYWGAVGGVLARPVVGMAAAPDGQGYWLVASDGGIFSFGTATFHGSMGGHPLDKPIVGMAAAPGGGGYWMVASDGGIFSFGTATFHGSMGGHPLDKPIVGMAPTPDGQGYWLVASDGGIFSFGTATFHGSMGGHPLDKPIVGMAAAPGGGGYWMVGADGGIFAFGSAPFYGSAFGLSLGQPIVAMAATVRPAATSSYAPCPASPVLGAAVADTEPVRVPAAPYLPIPGASDEWSFPPAAERPAAFEGTLVTPTTPGAYPSVVLMHGIGGSQCQVWWLAEYLSTQGYVVLTLNVPDPAGATPPSYGVAVDAARSGVAYLGSPALPGSVTTVPGDIGLVGWSEGAVAASEAQAMPDTGAVRAIVALDNLRGFLLGDSGAPVAWCVPPALYPVTARVPALSFASEQACPLYPSATGPTIKQSGWQAWQQAGVPAVEMVMAGFSHATFTLPSPAVAATVSAWLSTWLSGQNQLPAVTACTIAGQSTASLLSSTFRSAVYLPSSNLDVSDWRGYLAGRC